MKKSKEMDWYQDAVKKIRELEEAVEETTVLEFLKKKEKINLKNFKVKERKKLQMNFDFSNPIFFGAALIILVTLLIILLYFLKA